MTKDVLIEEDLLEDESIEIIEGSHQFPCPSCGGKMIFSPENQSLTCHYCENTLDIASESTTIIEYSLSEAEALADHNWGQEKMVIQCKQCGGQTVVDSSYKATNCVFCHSNHVIPQTDSVGIKPESLVPFKITDSEAKKRFKTWLKKRFYAPRKLKNQLKLDDVKGIYIPFFTYDSDTYTAYKARRGDYYYTTRTRRVNGKTVTERVRHTRWRNVSGVFQHYYDDVLINSSKKVDDKLISKIGGFNIASLASYQPEYLAGYMAERYSKSLKEGWDEGRSRVDQWIYQGIRDQVGGDEFRLVDHTTNYGDVKFKHLLLPLYMASFMYRDKVYQFIVNGATGQVASQYPKSVLKILGTIVLVGFVVAMILYYLNNMA